MFLMIRTSNTDMANIKVELTDFSPEVLAAKNDAVLRFLEEAGLHLEGEAADELENSPRRVDTGRLKGSITHRVVGDRDCYVGTNVDYGIYVHEGTMYMTANRFLKNAFERNERQLQLKLKEALTD